MSTGDGELATFVGTLDADQTSGLWRWSGRLGRGSIRSATERASVSPGHLGSTAGGTPGFGPRDKIQGDGCQQERTEQDKCFHKLCPPSENILYDTGGSWVSSDTDNRTRHGRVLDRKSSGWPTCRWLQFIWSTGGLPLLGLNLNGSKQAIDLCPGDCRSITSLSLQNQLYCQDANLSKSMRLENLITYTRLAGIYCPNRRLALLPVLPVGVIRHGPRLHRRRCAARFAKRHTK